MADSPNDINDTLKSLNNVMGVMSDTLKDMNNTFREMENPAARLKENMDKVTINMRSIVSFASDWKETLGELLSMHKKLGSGGIFDAKTFGKAKQQLQGMLTAHKELYKRAGLTAQQQKVLNLLIDGLGNKIKEVDIHAKRLGRTMDDAMDSTAVIELSKGMKGLAYLAEKTAAGFKKIDLGPITTASKTISELTNKQGRLHKILSHAERLKGIHEGVQDRIQENTARFANRSYSAASKNAVYKNPKFGIGPQERIEKTHALRASYIPVSRDQYKKMSSAQKTMARVAATSAQSNLDNDVDEMAPQKDRSIHNVIDRIMARKILNARNTAAMNGESIGGGVIGEKGLNYMAKGGGSFTRGLGMAAEEGLSGMGGGVGGALSAAALPIAGIGIVGDIVKKVFDATADRNKDVYSKLGTAGIFNGNETGQRAFQNVRSSLTPTGMSMLYNPLGATYENNLKIAGAMASSGVNYTSKDRNNRTVDTIGNTVYTGARLAGMDETQGTEQIMKLLQQYHQSLDSTHTFFKQLNKDTMAAGITSTKYIQVIDSITSGFDNMAKSLDNVTGVMRVLGSTGSMTAEMLQDTMKTLQGPDKSLDQKAFIGTQMMGNSSMMNHLVNGYQGDVDSQVGVVRGALKQAGFSDEEASKMDLSSSAGVAKALDALNTRSNMMGADNRSALGVQTAGGDLADLQRRYTRLGAAKKFSANRTGAGAAEYAATGDLVPDSYFGKAMTNIGGMEAVMKYSNVNFGDLMSDPSKALNKNKLVISQVAKAIGVDPNMFQNIVEGIHTASSSYVNQAKGGSNDITDKEYQNLANLMGYKGKDNKSYIQGLNEDEVNKLTQKISQSPETLYNTMDSSSSLRKYLGDAAKAMTDAEEKNKSTEISASTRNTADIFATAFTNLFNSISEPLTALADFFESNVLLGGGKASALDQKNLKDALHSDPATAKYFTADASNDLKKTQGAAAFLSSYSEKLKSQAAAMTNPADAENKKKYEERAQSVDDYLAHVTDVNNKMAKTASDIDHNKIKYDRDADEAKDNIKQVHQLAQDLHSHGVTMGKDGKFSMSGDLTSPMKWITAANPIMGDSAANVSGDKTDSTDNKAGGTTIVNNTVNQIGNIQATHQIKPDSTTGGSSETAKPINSGATNSTPFTPIS